MVARLLFGVPMPAIEPGGLPLGSPFGLFSTIFDALSFDRVLTPLVSGVAGLATCVWSITLPFFDAVFLCCVLLFLIAELFFCVSTSSSLHLEPLFLGSGRCPFWPFFVSLIGVALLRKCLGLTQCS